MSKRVLRDARQPEVWPFPFQFTTINRDDFPVRIWTKKLPKKDTSPRTVDMRRSKTSHA